VTDPYYTDDTVTLHHGDCLDVLREMPDASVDAVVTDPPYGLEFMGKDWDSPWKRGDNINADAGMASTSYTDGATRLPRPTFTGSTNPKCQVCRGTRRGRRDGTAKVKVCLCEDGGNFPNVRAAEMRAFQQWCEQWAAECLRVMKPGAHLLAFGGTRTWHRLTCAIEDAGFEIRDNIADLGGGPAPTAGLVWLHGQGFSKGRDFPRLDYAANGDHENAAKWAGWNVALKPAFEPVVVARKPLAGTIAQNVLTYGTGALNVDGCRVEAAPGDYAHPGNDNRSQTVTAYGKFEREGRQAPPHTAGRWPPNVVLDGDAAQLLDQQTGTLTSGKMKAATRRSNVEGWAGPMPDATGAETYGDSGGASRFFPVFRYETKAPTSERPRVPGETGDPVLRLRGDLTDEECVYVLTELERAGVDVARGD
jgi:hypothetical protein